MDFFDIFLVILALAGPIIAVPLAIWGFFVLRRAWREQKSLAAAKGDEMALSLEKLRLKSWLLKIAAVILGLAGFVLGLAFGAGLAIAAFIGLACGGLMMLWAASFKKRYNAGFKENVVKAELSKVFQNLHYEPKGQFSEESVKRLNFFASADQVSGNDLISAEYKGLSFSQCDMCVSDLYQVTVTDSDGDSRTEDRSREVFRGRAMRFDFAAKFRGRVEVLRRDFTGARADSSREGRQRVETELAEFNKHFEVFAQDPLDAMAALTPQMIEGIFLLNATLDVPLALCFLDNAMLVFIAMRRESFDVSGKHTLLEERAMLREDIALVTNFMETMYFKPQEKAADKADAGAPSVDAASRANLAMRSGEERVAAALALAPSEAEKFLRKARRAPGRAMGLVKTCLPAAVIGVFLISAIYAMMRLPDGITVGVSYSGGEWAASGLTVPTLAYLAAAGLFVIVPALSRSFVSLIFLGLYLLFLLPNIG